MKKASPFILIYFIISISIYTFYFYSLKDEKDYLESTKTELNGIAYLKDIYKLSISVALYHGNLIFENSPQIVEKSKENVNASVEAINNRIKQTPKFKNNEFLEKVNNLKKITKENEEKLHSFLDDANHENYRVGDISKLLFEKDRKFYFLSALATHYIPEYLISTIHSHNIIEELIKFGHISKDSKDRFIEQNKLIFLSVNEIKEITNLIKIYDDTEELDTIINKIISNLNRLSKTVSSIENMQKNPSLAKEYLNITHNILELSYILNDRNMFLIEVNLEMRKETLQNTILIYKISLFIILLFIAALIFYFYKSYLKNILIMDKLKKEKAKTQKALEFKSQFLSNMSHEIRTPLNSIISLIDLTIKTKLNDKQKYMLDKVNAASNILLGVVNDILDISKIESGKMNLEINSIDLKKCVHDVYNMLLIKAQENNISLTLNFEAKVDKNVFGDSLRISQILTNLVNNAIKFTRDGSVDINIKKDKNNYYIFEVKDTGIGLKEEQIATLFEEFTQADMSTSRKYGGTGLGLSISKKLVEMMGGKIWLESKFGKGSTFSFSLVLQEDNTPEVIKTDNLLDDSDIVSKINRLQNINILVAEDNKMNQMVINMLLEDSMINIDFADDGQIAVDMFNTHSYNLILMDIQMPNMNGYEATENIKKINPTINIVGLSANAMQEDITKAFEHGMDDYLTKPIDIDKLYRTLHKYLC